VDSQQECQNLIYGQVCVCVCVWVRACVRACVWSFLPSGWKPLPKVKLWNCDEYLACLYCSEPTLICRSLLPTTSVSLVVTICHVCPDIMHFALLCSRPEARSVQIISGGTRQIEYMRSIDLNGSAVWETFCFSNDSSNLTHILPSEGSCSSVVGWGTMLQAGMSRVRFLLRSFDFSIDLILLTALWPWSRLSL
jgi:hypothetical protein